jgi:hypothetical protein
MDEGEEAFRMRRIAGRLALGITLLAFLGGPVGAQEKEKQEPLKKAEDDYRLFLRKPETVQDFWAAIKFEVDVGKYDLAAEYLKGFLAKNPSDADLLELEAQDGLSTFLRLTTIEQLRPQAKPLLQRVSDLVRKHRSDPERIGKYIGNLNAPTAEERDYALYQLRLSGAEGVPYLVDALRGSVDTPEHTRILHAVSSLGKGAVPALVAALDVNDATLRLEIIAILEQRTDTAAIPFLWYLSASSKQPETVRRKALEALATLHGVAPEKLPAAKVALTREAERYYNHQVHFIDPRGVVVWQSDGKKVFKQVMPATQAEEYYGLRFAGQALDLDPNYKPAQVAYLSVALDKGFERAGIDQPLDKGAPSVRELLKVVNPDLVANTLDRALQENRLPVILGTVRALGELGDIRAAKSVNRQEPGLLRALYYPDRRVQVAAADTLLSLPTTTSYRNGARLVEVLRRVVGGDGGARALIGCFDQGQAQKIADAVRQAGFEPEIKNTGREVLRRLKAAGDVDIVILDQAIPDPPLPYMLGQLRADCDVGLLPVFITVEPSQFPSIRSAREQRLLEVAERSIFVDREGLKRQLMAMDQEDLLIMVADLDVQRGSVIDPTTLKRDILAPPIDPSDIRRKYRDMSKEQLVQRYLNMVQPLPTPDKYELKRQLVQLDAIEIGNEVAARRQMLRNLMTHYRNVWLMPAMFDKGEMKKQIMAHIGEAMGRPLSDEERKGMALLAIRWLKRLAGREVPGYDVKPAQGAILKALNSPDLVGLAIEAAGRLPGREPQLALADVVLRNPSADAKAAAAAELSHHIQLNGLVLSPQLVQGIEALYASSTDPKVKAGVALVLGSLRPDGRRTAARLQDFKPPPWVAAPQAPEKEDKAPPDKEDKKEKEDKKPDKEDKKEKEDKEK